MELEISHCNNLDFAKVILHENKLNIKFAPNGTGKSTLAKAIQYSLGDSNISLSELIPFKLRESNPDNVSPTVIGIDSITGVMCFNEDYVSQITFQPDELVSNSFDIFIRNEKYRALEQEIENIMLKIKTLFTDNPELETLISNLQELGGAFKLTKTGLSKASTGMKGLSKGNKIRHIPPGLEQFSPFIQSEKNVIWIDWQVKGNDFLELTDDCPFCASTIDDKEKIKKVGQEYNKSVIKNLIGLINITEKLGDYFSDEAKSRLATITTLEDGPESEHELFLVNIKKQIDNFVEKLEKLKTLSSFEFKDGERVSQKLPSYKLDLQFFSELDSIKTQDAVASINASIDELTQQAGVLQGKINSQRSEMQKVVAKHQDDINGFLAYAGYRYKVEIAGDSDHPQLKLLHSDYSEHLSGGSQHLSFGERNAFAIVLFMYECLAKKPDLIILDDPISSFDKNKKYAMLEMLFRRNSTSCLKSKTVLMLTHDVEPIIDTLKSVAKQFQNQISASYLNYSRGHLAELPITKDDIQTFSQICKSTLASNKDDIIKLIYLRRYCEITDDRGDAYQVLSNLFHKRGRANDSREPRGNDGAHPEMEECKFERGCMDIQTHIEGFEYQAILNQILDQTTLRSLYDSCQNRYEKLQLFRLFGLDVDNSVIQKFINETYHIENEFICQLNPEKFDMIPEYVIDECNRYITCRSVGVS
ncbi:MAG: AAA family ATPase [Cyanobacteria bacterium J06554_1]